MERDWQAATVTLCTNVLAERLGRGLVGEPEGSLFGEEARMVLGADVGL